MPNQKSILEATRVLYEVFPEAYALLPARMNSISANAIMLAIGFQESDFNTRVQLSVSSGRVFDGPARSYWQFESGGGIRGVLTHRSTEAHAISVCRARGVNPVSSDVWARMREDDVLGACFARLLLWSSPYSLPNESEVDLAWRLYSKELWRPGDPHPSKWADNYAEGWRLAKMKGLQ